MESIIVDQLKEKIPGSNPVNIIDVRADEETTMDTIPGAKTIPMDQIADNLDQFNKNETYYVVCAVDVRSEKVANYPENEGIHAVNVEGGVQAWGDEGIEIGSI